MVLENLKQKLLNRIERNAVKSEMSWTDKDGNVTTELVYTKRSQMPLIGDWARIYPPVNEDGSWNIINLIFGGKKNLIKLIAILIIVGFVLFQFYQNFTYLKFITNNPCVQACLNIAKLN